MGDVRDELNAYFADYYAGYKGNQGSTLSYGDDGIGDYSPTNTSAKLNYSELFSPEQYASIERKAGELGKSTDALAGIIWHESGGNTQAVNPTSGATGLIQFMDKTAKGLGTSQADIMNMSFDEQLDLTGTYLKGYGSKFDQAQTATD